MISASLDTVADALYLQIRRGRVARTEELDSGTLVDLDTYGDPLGIEVIHPGRAWPLDEFLQRYNVSDYVRSLLLPFAPASAVAVQHSTRASHTGTAVAIAL